MNRHCSCHSLNGSIRHFLKIPNGSNSIVTAVNRNTRYILQTFYRHLRRCSGTSQTLTPVSCSDFQLLFQLPTPNFSKVKNSCSCSGTGAPVLLQLLQTLELLFQNRPEAGGLLLFGLRPQTSAFGLGPLPLSQ